MAFHDLARKWVFAPLLRRVGLGGAAFAVFLVSGAVHDAVIVGIAAGSLALVTDAEILAAQSWLASNEGIFVEPASAASIAGLFKFLGAERGPLRDQVGNVEDHDERLCRPAETRSIAPSATCWGVMSSFQMP